MHKPSSTSSRGERTRPTRCSRTTLSIALIQSPALFHAMRTAVVFSLKSQSFSKTVMRGLGLFRQLLTILQNPKLDRKRYLNRMSQCRRCPIFNKKRKTCGTAGEMFNNPRTGKRETLGCWCLVTVKNLLKCNCWLYDITSGEQGWPKELNDYE